MVVRVTVEPQETAFVVQMVVEQVVMVDKVQVTATVFFWPKH
jgi:hypothetical protein